MRTKPTWPPGSHPQSVGNVALADESLGGLHASRAKPFAPQLRLVRDVTEEQGETEARAPTMGMINGLRLSLTLWSLIVLLIVLLY